MLKGLIFDIGGVLTNDPWEAMVYSDPGSIARQRGIDPGKANELIRPLIKVFFYSPPLQGGGEAGVLEYIFWQQAIRLLALDDKPNDLIGQTHQFVRPVPGMAELVLEIREKGIPLVLCSNTSEFFYKRQMEALGLRGLFSPHEEILSCRCRTSKTDPQGTMFKAAVSALGLAPEECLLVDDREENFPPAHRVGVAAVLFPRYSDFGATYLRNLFKLLGIL